MLLGVFQFSNQFNYIEPKAAAIETKRIWAIAREAWWFNDGVSFGVATATGFEGISALNYTTYILQRDQNNFDLGVSPNNYSGLQSYAFYVDIPTNITHVEFFREASPTNRFNYSGWSTYTSGMKYVFDGYTTEFAGYLFEETKIVENFSLTTNNLEGSCTFANVESIILAYNNLATFEQNQFDAKDFSGVTGLERLNYLIEVSGATTALN
jgi:hypothetical protein